MSVWCRTSMSHHDVRAHDEASSFFADARHALQCEPLSTELWRMLHDGGHKDQLDGHIGSGAQRAEVQAKTSEQNDSEEVGWDGRLPIRRGHCQRRPCTWSSLRPDQCLRLIWNAGEHVVAEFAFHARTCFLLPTPSSGSWLAVFRLLVGGRAPRARASHDGGSNAILPINWTLHCEAAWKKGVAGSPLSSATNSATGTAAAESSACNRPNWPRRPARLVVVRA